MQDRRAEKGILNPWAMRPSSVIRWKVALGDHPGGDLDRNGVELEEPEKGKAFDEMWGIKGK